jgi:histidinol-phosphate aminotransferase
VNKLLQLANRSIAKLTPYQSARRLFSGGRLFLNANESPFANDYQVDSEHFNRYPDCQPPELVTAYANYAGLTKEQVLATRGADEGIELLVRSFCNASEDSILICPPTYGMYAISAETFSVGVKTVPAKPDFSLDIEAINAYKGQVKVVFICSPNNPTGNIIDPAQIEAIIEHYTDSAIVVVDEAYIEFAPQSTWANKVNNYSNLVVLRTLSKAFALAGLRCGFTLANSDIIQILLKAIAPYPISAPVAQIATTALSETGLAVMAEQVNYIEQQRTLIAEVLANIPQIETIFPSSSNYILFRVADASALMNALVEQGILIRDQSKQLMLSNCLRITVGSENENNQVLAAINTFYSEGNC